MARKFGSVNVEIWNDPEFRKLPPAAQHLYLLLWTAPALSFCGVHEWRPGRLTKLSYGFTEEHTRTVAACLVARHFLVIDEDTEEVLVRSWARFDGLLKQPKLAISYTMAYAEVYSPTLRMVLAHEARKMRDLWPDISCWKDPRLQEILKHEAISAKDLPTPEDPFTPGLTPTVTPGLTLGLDQTQLGVYPSVYPPPTPAPTPTPNTFSADDADAPSKSKKAHQLPEGWQPNDGHRTYAETNCLIIDEEAAGFRDHHQARGSTMKDWDAAFRTWLRNGVKFAAERNANKAPEPRRLPHVADVPQPPDGLTDAQYRDWWEQNMRVQP